MAICVPGHALELEAITQRETLVSLRRQVNRDPDLCAKATQLRDHVQHQHGGGPIGRLVQTLSQLNWSWPSFGVLLDDWGTRISWLRVPQGCLLHMLRASQRRAFLRKIQPSRYDLGHLPLVKQGVDMFATTWLARTRGARKLCAWKLGLLYNYITGGDHTQIRCVKAGITADPSPMCRYCDTEMEGQEHTIWRCPCWAEQRRPLTDMLTQQQWDSLPPHTRCCGIIEESEELLSLQAELSRDPSTLHTALVLPPAGSLERGSWSGLWLQGTDLVGIQEQLWWMVMFEAVHPEKNPDFSWARTAAVGKDWGAGCEGLGEGTWISSGQA